MKQERRTGFTLIELLVVIAIIAILASILLPVFATARERARQSSCQNNEKQMGTALIAYAQDFDEKFPTGYGYDSGGNGYGWQQIVFPYIKSTGVFRCPDDSDMTTDVFLQKSLPPIQPIFHSSYMANYQLMWDGNDGGGRNLSVVNSPATTVMVVEGGAQNGTGSPPAGYYVTATSVQKPSWLIPDPGTNPCGTGAGRCNMDMSSGSSGNNSWGGPSLRHSGRVNVCYTDGHVKTVDGTWYTNNTPWLDPARGG